MGQITLFALLRTCLQQNDEAFFQFILMKANTAKIVAILQNDNQKKCPSKGN